MRTAALLCILALPASAQEQPGHSLFHHYYQYWFNRLGTHCCDERHCRPLDPDHARWNQEQQRWEVFLEDEWIAVGDMQYVRDDGGLGPFPTICHTRKHIFCFDPPDPLM